MSSELTRRDWSTRLFKTYDIDKSGEISSDEFLEIIRVLDPSLRHEDVEKTFHAVGASNSLDEEHLWLWCANVFGDFSDQEFADQLQELIDACEVPEKFVGTAPPSADPQPANDLTWLIDAAQHELQLLEAVSREEEEPVKAQLGRARAGLSSPGPAKPAMEEDQSMVKRARQAELELVEMAAGQRELKRAEEALTELGLAELDAAAHQEASARLAVRYSEHHQVQEQCNQLLLQLAHSIPTPPGCPPLPCKPRAKFEPADPEEAVQQSTVLLSQAVARLEWISDRVSDFVAAAQIKLGAATQHLVPPPAPAPAPVGSPEGTARLRAEIDALLASNQPRLPAAAESIEEELMRVREWSRQTVQEAQMLGEAQVRRTHEEHVRAHAAAMRELEERHQRELRGLEERNRALERQGRQGQPPREAPEAVEASVQATRCILLSINRMISRHQRGNLVRAVLWWQRVAQESKLADGFFERTQARMHQLTQSSEQRLHRSLRAARAFIIAQVFNQLWSNRLTYGFATWRARVGTRAQGPGGGSSGTDGPVLIAVLRAVLEGCGPGALHPLSTPEIHQLVTVLKQLRSDPKPTEELGKVAAAVLAEANRRIGFTEAAAVPLAASQSSGRMERQTKFEVSQDDVEMALANYQRQRLASEERKLDSQAVRVAQAEAQAALGLGSSSVGAQDWAQLFRSSHPGFHT